MNQKSSLIIVKFDGVFTPALRRRLQAKRLELGLPYQRLGMLLQINWSTIRKWECGQTRCCNINLRKRVENFLNGKYDKLIIKQMQDPLTGSYPIRPSYNVIKCMEKFSNTYQILKRTRFARQPDKNLDLVTNQSIEHLFQSTLTKSLTTIKQSSKSGSRALQVYIHRVGLSLGPACMPAAATLPAKPWLTQW